MTDNNIQDLRPIIVQSDGSMLLDVHNPAFEDARSDISVFAELEKSPEHMHTYRLSSISLWNAASAGISPDEMIKKLKRWSKFEVPENIIFRITESAGLFGKIVLKPTDDPYELLLKTSDERLYSEIKSIKKLQKILLPTAAKNTFLLKLIDRGTIKQELINSGYPVKDEVPLVKGGPLDISLRKKMLSGYDLNIRDYQQEAADTFYGGGKPGNGFGTIVLACGSGKTVVGMTIMDIYKTKTLIITTNIAAVHQWKDELLDKTSLTEDMIGEYSGDRKEIKPVTIATYQILTWRPDKKSDFPHFDIFRKNDWGAYYL